MRTTTAIVTGGLLHCCFLSALVAGGHALAEDTITPATVKLQDLILVDYRERSPSPISLPTYHQKLIDYMKPTSAGGQGLAPPRLILYVNSPCAGSGQSGDQWYDFYDPNATCTTNGDLTFVGFVKAMHDSVPGTELEILVDASVVAGWSNTCWSGPAGAGFPVTLSADWTGVPNLMEWVRAVYNTLSTDCSVAAADNPLKGITFDQEVPGHSTRDDIAIILGLDWFKSQSGNAMLSNFRVGMMPGVGGNSTYSVLVSDFPVSSWPGCLQSIVWVCAPTCEDCTQSTGVLTHNFTDFSMNLDPTGNFPAWRDSSNTGSLVQSCYLQVYSACASNTYQYSFYKWANAGDCHDATAGFTARTPEEASIALSGSLRRVPTTPGQGSVQFTNPGTNTVDLVGTGTNFSELTPYTRVLLDDGGSLLPDPAFPLKIVAASSDIAATGSGCAPASGGCASTTSSLPWVYTEIPALYASPPLPSDGNTRMFFMFSAENSDDDTSGTAFFGNWTRPDFLDFVGYFYAYTQKYPLWSVDNSQTTSKAVELSNFVIYDVNWICKNWTSMATLPPCSSNRTGTCLEDYTSDGVVEGDDLTILLSQWGEKCDPAFPACIGDLNGDFTINGADLGILLGKWGPCEG